MSPFRIAKIAIAFAAIAAPAAAQDSTCAGCQSHVKRPPSELARRSEGNFAFIQSRPVGQLGDNIGFGYGVNAAYLFRLDHAGALSLRADVGFLDYGGESKRVPLSPTIGGRIQVKVSTNNNIVPFSVGPQLTWPTGRVRPYVNAGVGGQFFFTESSIDGGDQTDGFSTTNQHDATAAWVAGGGVYIPVYTRQMSALLDLGVQYVAGGHAQYLRPGSIEDLPDSQIRITPLESDTHMLVVRVGVKIGIGRTNW